MHLHVCVQEIDIIYTAKIKENFFSCSCFSPLFSTLSCLRTSKWSHPIDQTKGMALLQPSTSKCLICVPGLRKKRPIFTKPQKSGCGCRTLQKWSGEIAFSVSDLRSLVWCFLWLGWGSMVLDKIWGLDGPFSWPSASNSSKFLGGTWDSRSRHAEQTHKQNRAVRRKQEKNRSLKFDRDVLLSFERTD